MSHSLNFSKIFLILQNRPGKDELRITAINIGVPQPVIKCINVKENEAINSIDINFELDYSGSFSIDISTSVILLPFIPGLVKLPVSMFLEANELKANVSIFTFFFLIIEVLHAYLL